MLLALLAVLTIAAIAVSVRTDHAARVATTTPVHRGNPYGAPSYAFGGYSLDEPTTEISAQWRVPAISNISPGGDASTWIAVEDDQRQFIQLGTTENRYENAVPLYGVFWSDVTVNFHPQQLVSVDPGDLITFTMVQVARGWRLSFDDVTDGTPETITVPYGRGSNFDTAQWIQEDPTIGGPAHHIPYPVIAPTTFTHLTLDNSSPRFQLDDGSVLSTADGVYMIPTLPAHDQFSFRDAAGPTRQYLQDVFAYDAALYPFRVDLFYNQSPSRAVLGKMESTLTTLKSDLKSQTWPKSMKPTVKRLTKEMTRFLEFYPGFSVAPQPLNGQELARLDQMNFDNDVVANAFRRELGLPPI
jgi:hypothetical protein